MPCARFGDDTLLRPPPAAVPDDLKANAAGRPGHVAANEAGRGLGDSDRGKIGI